MRAVADLVRNHYHWPANAKLLDFGCGYHGSVATNLCDLASRTVAVDTNEHAVEAFNSNCKNQGLEFTEVGAYITQDFTNSPRFKAYFDLAVASLVWHHIDSTDRLPTLLALITNLKPGGVLYIIDVDNAQNPEINGVTAKELYASLQAAQFGSVGVDKGPRITLSSGRKTRLLMAHGVRESGFNSASSV